MVLGSISGALDIQLQNNQVVVRTNVADGSPFEADAIVERGGEKVLIEVKSRRTMAAYAQAIAHIDRYGDSNQIMGAILLFYGETTKFEVNEEKSPEGRRILVVGPARSSL